LHEILEIASTLIVPLGTQVVLRLDLPSTAPSQPVLRGTVAEIVRVPTDGSHSYGLRCADGAELKAFRQNFSILKQVKMGPIGDADRLALEHELGQYVIYRCVVGSQAYGLSREGSDIDRRGIYLPPADLEWSLYGVPEQLENRATEECYWELKKFIVLALKANPNILECLWSPIVEHTSEVAEALVAKREIFLSKLVYQTYNGYVMSQFKKLEQDLCVKDELNWKHAMHLIRLLLQGIGVMTEQQVGVRVVDHRDALLAIRHGGQTWAEVNEWRLALHREFAEAFRRTTLPDAPDYSEANRLLIWARRQGVEVRHDS
jgi:predicted nucleotidyltransferase